MQCGCGAAQKSTGVVAAQPVVAMVQPQPADIPRDAAADSPAIFHVEMFLLNPPEGTFSGNEDFWKRIDEQCVDPATASLLQSNGIRVGLAPLSELESFDKYMDESHPVQKLAVVGSEVKDAQIDMKPEVPEQIIFHLDKTNTPVGRTFGKSENIINISFEPAPRKPGQLRLTVCPMVRATRRQMRFTELNSEYELEFVNPEHYYDLNFRVDIPPEHFLVVTPSASARITTSVGHAFFIKEAPAERQEQVLIVVPHPIQIDPRATVAGKSEKSPG